jgi:hypothetical protein
MKLDMKLLLSMEWTWRMKKHCISDMQKMDQRTRLSAIIKPASLALLQDAANDMP